MFATSVGTKMSAGNVRRDFRRALALVPGIDPSMFLFDGLLEIAQEVFEAHAVLL